MSARLRLVCFAGLLIGCAAALGTGCSDDNTKKKAGSAGEAGEAGEAGQAASGAGGKGGAGSGGMTPVAGEGGLPSEAGQGGAAPGMAGAAGAAEAGATSSEGGAGGAPGFACTPSGTVTGVTFVSEGAQTVCRGARIQASFNANDALGRFLCCGVSDTTTPYGVELKGVTNIEATFGVISLIVPTDAPLGPQSISATCSDGPATNTLDIDVSDATVPVVTEISPVTFSSNQTITLTGEHLDQVSQVFAVPDDPSNSSAECFISAEATSGSLSCSFDGIAPGQYKIVATENNCGAAVNWPNLTVTPVTQ
jgi:hypothetical protein